MLKVRYDVRLTEIVGGRDGGVLVHGDKHGVVQGQPGEVRDVPGLGGGEQQCLSLGRDVGHDAVDGRGEAEVETSVGLVKNQQLEVVDREGRILVQMLQKTARSTDQDVAVRHSGPFKF